MKPAEADAIRGPQGPAEQEVKLFYKAGDMMKDEDFDPSRLPLGYEFAYGRVSRKSKTRRPPDVWPETWRHMTKNQQDNAVAEYEEKKKAAE